ncbi:hypothetical protein OF83DRAFT_1173884 [Amylostereum chailletii]|nr:hypothetical protein OF83DRAFT_1173884 [Amylostereum chailletii]
MAAPAPALPSFVQLMDSLGLDDHPYLFVPTHSDPFDRDADIRLSRHGKERYSPYGSVSRRVSMPALNPDSDPNNPPSRATSTSPLHSVAGLRKMRSSHSGGSSRRGSQSWSAADLQAATTPISTFVRRKSPHSPSVSPTVASFPRSLLDYDSPLAPVAIPALPILLPTFLMPSPTADSDSARSFSSSEDRMDDSGSDTRSPSLLPQIIS